MARKKGNPGCPCCDPCLIQSTDLTSLADLTGNFTLEDTANFDYDATLGGIKISAASQTATANTLHPQSPYPPRVQIEFYADTVGGQVRVILGESVIIQITAGDAYSTLRFLDATDERELTDPIVCPGATHGAWNRLTVCYNPDTKVVMAVVLILPNTSCVTGYAIYSESDVIGRTASIGTGPSSVGNVYVKNFRYWRLWYCGESPFTSDCHVLRDDWDYYYELPERTDCFECGAAACQYCLEGTWSTSSAVEIANLRNATPGEPCDCDQYNATYYPLAPSGSLGCLHTYDADIDCSPGVVVPGFTRYSITQQLKMYLQWGPTGLGTYPLAYLTPGALYVIVQFIITEAFAPVPPITGYYIIIQHLFYGRILRAPGEYKFAINCKEEVTDYVLQPLLYGQWIQWFASYGDGSYGGSVYCNTLAGPSTATVTLL